MKKFLISAAIFCHGICGSLHDSAEATPVGSEERRVRPTPESKPYPEFDYDKLWELETHFWDRFTYPANIEEAESINSTLFSENVQGRVDITRNFPGRELNTEYLFGLFADPHSVTLLNLPVSYEIVQFAANDYIAAASTVVMFNSTLLGVQIPVTINTFIAWNDQKEIVQYDATFRWFGFFLDTIIGYAGKKYGLSTYEETVAALSATLATSICKIHDDHCTGANQQYEDNATCFEFLTKTIRFGKDYELGQNTLLCRSIHQQMVHSRPEVHCSHIGPTGGEMCVDDQSYEEKVLEDYFTNAPFVVDPRWSE